MSSKVTHKNDLINLVYGCIVKETLAECKDNLEECNKRLEQIGFDIGMRLIDEFLIKTESESCKTFKDVMEKIALAFKLYLGIETRLLQRNDAEFSITMFDNPFDENVFLPNELKILNYSIIICGLIKGALECLNYRVKCYFVYDRFSQNHENNVGKLLPNYEISVEMVEIIKRKLINYDE
jgi:hypothetical protein